MDKILLNGVKLDLHIGAIEEERAVAQTILADVELEYNIRAAALADDVTKTVDYAAVHDAVVSVATWRRYALIESLAEAIAAAVLDRFEVDSVRVRIRKPGALQSRGVDWAGVEITRRRGG
ncbi:MAG: dihydroneopterin aldolase [Bryobacterales bacterium]|nr:dihydroneopterin aldolase [Bryobacterales bacterium]